MRWSAKLAAVALVALMTLPTAYTLQQEPVVSGHTTYANMDGLDPCLAGIVGIVRLRVMWFNDQVLFERPAEDGSTYLYALESGAPDPRAAELLPTGREFNFTDPNGLDWDVKEYNFTAGPTGVVDGGNVTYSTNPVGAGFNRNPSVDPANLTTYYVWVVQTGPTVADYAATGRSYNFVDLVDTCKFHQQGQQVVQTRGSDGNWTSSWANDTTQNQHLASDPSPSYADRYDVDLYAGQAPRVLAPVPTDPQYLGVPQ